MQYVNHLDYLNNRFGEGQLEILNEKEEVVSRGDISSFALHGGMFSVSLKWLAEKDADQRGWSKSKREDLLIMLDMDEWSDTCHGGGRIGLTKDSGSSEFYRIIPNGHGSIIPLSAVK